MCLHHEGLALTPRLMLTTPLLRTCPLPEPVAHQLTNYLLTTEHVRRERACVPAPLHWRGWVSHRVSVSPPRVGRVLERWPSPLVWIKNLFISFLEDLLLSFLFYSCRFVSYCIFTTSHPFKTESPSLRLLCITSVSPSLPLNSCPCPWRRSPPFKRRHASWRRSCTSVTLWTPRPRPSPARSCCCCRVRWSSFRMRTTGRVESRDASVPTLIRPFLNRHVICCCLSIVEPPSYNELFLCGVSDWRTAEMTCECGGRSWSGRWSSCSCVTRSWTAWHTRPKAWRTRWISSGETSRTQPIHRRS